MIRSSFLIEEITCELNWRRSVNHIYLVGSKRIGDDMCDLLVYLVCARRAKLLGRLPQRMEMGVSFADGENPAEDDPAPSKDLLLFGRE